jgi:hypothetical protein
MANAANALTLGKFLKVEAEAPSLGQDAANVANLLTFSGKYVSLENW